LSKISIDPHPYQKFVHALGCVDIDENIIQRGFYHLSALEREQLFDEKHSTKRIAEGHLYEHCVFEIMVDLIEHDDDFKAILEKRKRITISKPLKPGKMGFVHKHGDIFIECDHTDHAELDSVIMDSAGNYCIIEAINGSVNLDGLPRDYSRKQSILKKMTGKDTIPFLLISSEDVHNKQPICKVMSNPHTYFAHVGFDKYCSFKLGSERFSSMNNLPHRSKVMGISAFPLIQTDYTSLCDQAKKRVVDGLSLGKIDSEEFRDYDFLNKILLSRVSIPFLVELLEIMGYNFIGSGENHPISILNRMNFDYAILAFELNDMRGSIYLKRKNEARFIKLGPRYNHTLEVERAITKRAGGFYRSLVQEKRVLDDRIINNYFESFFSNPTGERRKRWDRPTLESLLEGSG